MKELLMLALMLISVYLFSDECGIKSLGIEWSWIDSISSDYGPRNVDKGSLFHRGIDIAKPYGTPIPAILEGEIKSISYDEDSGWYIKVSSGNREFSYCHIFSGNRNNIPQQLNNKQNNSFKVF